MSQLLSLLCPCMDLSLSAAETCKRTYEVERFSSRGHQLAVDKGVAHLVEAARVEKFLAGCREGNLGKMEECWDMRHRANSSGEKGLHAAARGGQAEVVQMLLIMGAKDVKNGSGKTASDVAVERGRRDIVEILELAMNRKIDGNMELQSLEADIEEGEILTLDNFSVDTENREDIEEGEIPEVSANYLEDNNSYNCNTSVIRHFECRGCLVLISPNTRIWQCVGGHLYCDQCQRGQYLCQICGEIIAGRSIAMEKLCSALLHPEQHGSTKGKIYGDD